MYWRYSLRASKFFTEVCLKSSEAIWNPNASINSCRSCNRLLACAYFKENKCVTNKSSVMAMIRTLPWLAKREFLRASTSCTSSATSVYPVGPGRVNPRSGLTVSPALCFTSCTLARVFYYKTRKLKILFSWKIDGYSTSSFSRMNRSLLL